MGLRYPRKYVHRDEPDLIRCHFCRRPVRSDHAQCNGWQLLPCPDAWHMRDVCPQCVREQSETPK